METQYGNLGRAAKQNLQMKDNLNKECQWSKKYTK